MKKIFKQKKFWVILIIIVLMIGFGVFKLLTNKPQTEYTTEPVKKGKLVQTVSATGAIESAHEIELNFKNPGKLTMIQAKEGDEVKAGDVLAQIDSAGIGALINQYRANLASAEANLAKITVGASTEDIKVTEQNLAKAESDLSSLITERDNQIKIYADKVQDSLNNSVYTSQVALDTIYNDLLNTGTTAGLAVKNYVDYGALQNNYDQVQINFLTTKKVVNNLTSNKTNNDIIAAAESTRSFLISLNNLLNDAFKIADNIIINNTYTQTVKDAVKADISAQQVSNNTSLTSVQTARSTLVTNIDSYNSQIAAAQKNIEIYQAQLDLKRAPARSFDIDAAKASVAQARAQLDKALSDASDYIIKSPIDGKITQVNYKVGEQTSLTQAVVKIIGNEKYEIKVDVPESDITKIKVGNQVNITLDAFGSDHIFSGIVSIIDPASTQIQDVTYYKTTVSFNNDSWNDQIKPGMTANITVLANEKNDVLYIPQRAVKIRESALGEVGDKYVEVLTAPQTTVEKNVVIGLRGDNGLVEVVSGLTEGEQVVTFKKVPTN